MRENMGLYRGKRKDNEEWVEGYYVFAPVRKNKEIKIEDAIKKHWIITENGKVYEVIPETIGQFTDLTDKNGTMIFKGDIVKILDVYTGTIVFECGAFGVAIFPYIQWGLLECEIGDVTGCENEPHFCNNDNFISLWELMWNYNQEENWCQVVEVIGSIHDNPELLEVGENG